MDKRMFRALEAGSLGVLGLGAIWCGVVFVGMVIAGAAYFLGSWSALFDFVGGGHSIETQLRFWHPGVQGICLAGGVAMLPGVALVWIGDRGRKRYGRRRRQEQTPRPVEAPAS